MSNPCYSRAAKFRPGELIERLALFASQSNHEFWPGDLSLRDKTVFARDRLPSSRAIADVYLLALAAKHHGCLATFDQAIAASAVPGAPAAGLSVI
jgi:predicted nucleic acid-binding protein